MILSLHVIYYYQKFLHKIHTYSFGLNLHSTHLSLVLNTSERQRIPTDNDIHNFWIDPNIMPSLTFRFSSAQQNTGPSLILCILSISASSQKENINKTNSKTKKLIKPTNQNKLPGHQYQLYDKRVGQPTRSIWLLSLFALEISKWAHILREIQFFVACFE